MSDIIKHEINEECGIFGITNNDEASNFTYLGLHGLQHRGQESCGISSTDGKKVYRKVGQGQVAGFFTKKKLKNLKGDAAIGHVRYSTTGASDLNNAQPLVAITHKGFISLGHNGNLVNARSLRASLEEEGSIFSTTTDSEIVLHLMARSQDSNIIMAFIEAIKQIEGAFSIVVLTKNYLLAARDSNGIRPLSLGRLGSSYVVASESCAFDIINATFERDIEAGEVVAVDLRTGSLQSHKPFAKTAEKLCLFEYVYFAKPSSVLLGRDVHAVRYKSGIKLSEESKVDADFVVPVPDSGVPAALGYSDASGIPFSMALVRSHYIGRTFIEPTQSIRGFGVRLKFAAVRKLLEGKKIVLIDDSLVRGTTCGRIIKMLREVGTKEIHMRIASPKVAHPCFYGIDYGTSKELAADMKSTEEIARMVGADSLEYLSLKNLKVATEVSKDGLCDACFSGNYPVPIEDKHMKLAFEYGE